MLCALVVCAIAAAGDVEVADYGAVGDGVTDDGPAIREAIAAAKALGRPARVRLKRRTYRIGPRPERWCAFDFIDCQDITLDGNGANLVFNPRNRGFLILRSRNIELRDFTVDFDPLPFTEGDILEVNEAEGWFTIRLHNGYPDPPSHEWAVENHGAMAWRHGVFIAEGERRFTHHWVYIDRVDRVEGRVYRVQVQEGHSPVLANVAPGQRFVFRNRTADKAWQERAAIIGRTPEDRGVYHSNPAAVFQIRHSEDCAIRGVDIFCAPDMCVRLTGTRGTHIEDCHIAYKPGTDRLVVSLSDGIHAKNNPVGPVIERCSFEGLMDDSINLSTMSDTIMEVRDERTFLTQYSDIAYYDSCLRAGDRVRLWDPVEGRWLGEAVAESVEFVRSHARVVTLDRVVPGIRPADASEYDRATSMYVLNEEPAAVRDCRFRTQLKVAIVARVPTIVEGCDFDDTVYGVHCHNSIQFREGPIPDWYLIRGNHFRKVGVGAIVMTVLSENALMASVGERIVIEDNVIEEAEAGIQIDRLRHVRLRGNRIQVAASTPLDRLAVRMGDCADVEVDGLRIDDGREGIEAGVLVVRTPEGEVALRGVESVLAEGVPEVEFHD